MYNLGPARPGRVQSLQFDRPVAVIGDIHGRSDLLDRLFARLPKDIPILVAGDVCDRGPDTRGVIDRLIARNAAGVRGNHDEWLGDWANGRGFDEFALHPRMGGEATLTSYGVTDRAPTAIAAQFQAVPREHARWLETLPIALDLDVQGTRWWLIHAGIPSTVELRVKSLAEVVPFLVARHPAHLLWAANDPEEMLPLDRPIVMGHMSRNEPLDTGSVLAIDTGAGTLTRGRLTAVILPERRFVTVG